MLIIISINNSSNSYNSGNTSNTSDSSCDISWICSIVFGLYDFYKFWFSYFNIRWHFLLADKLRKVDKVGRKDIMLDRLSLWNISEFFLDIDWEMRKSWKEYVGFLILEESNVLFVFMKRKIVVVTDLVHLLDEIKSEGLAKLFLFHLLILISNLTLLIKE